MVRGPVGGGSGGCGGGSNLCRGVMERAVEERVEERAVEEREVEEREVEEREVEERAVEERVGDSERRGEVRFVRWVRSIGVGGGEGRFIIIPPQPSLNIF